MPTLGKFKIPSDMNKAGDPSKKVQGSEQGIQKPFYGACIEYKKWLESKGYTCEFKKPENGVYNGFITKDEMQQMEKDGKKTWSYDSQKRLYGWGLALQIELYKKDINGNRESVNSNDLNDVVQEAMNEGLTLRITNGTTATLEPKNVEVDNGANDISYEGDDYADIVGNATANANNGENGDGSSGASIASISYFFTSSAFKNMESNYLSYQLKGERALANDEPIWLTVKQIANSSLRSICSDPKGRIVAFYPDYFGLYTDPIMTIEDIDLIDLKVTQSDDTYYSHVFVPGVNVQGGSMEVLNSIGVVSIESDAGAAASAYMEASSDIPQASDEVPAIFKKLINIPEGEEWKYTPKELFRRYGARPKKGASSGGGINLTTAKVIEMNSPNSDNPTYILPYLMALYTFMNEWANQNKVDLTITFQPSLYPGCRIRLKSFDVSMYISSVSHSMNYSSGFTTNITAICPTGTLVSGMVNIKRDK